MKRPQKTNRTLTKLKAKAPFIIGIVTIAVVVIVGVYILMRVFASGVFIQAEPEGGTISGNASSFNSSTASGGKGVKFNLPADKFTSAIKSESGGTSIKKGSFASKSKFEGKKYPKYNLVQVADAATTAVRSCSIGPILDKRLTPEWTSCETWQETGWRQQGLTGISGSGYSSRKDIMLVSWHDGGDNNARLTVINTTTKKQIFVSLIAACDDSDAVCSLGSTNKCAGIHAGGVAWYKMNLLVADSDCIIVFNVNEVYKLPNGTYVMPAMHYWKRSSGSLTYSSAGINTSGSQPILMLSEYETGGCGRTNFTWFDLDTTNAQPVLNKGSSDTAAAEGIYSMPQCYAQGLTYYNGMWFFNTSGSGNDYMYRYRTSRFAPPDTSLLMPKNTPQGIFIDKANDLMWALTESPTTNDNNARVFSFPLGQATEQ